MPTGIKRAKEIYDFAQKNGIGATMKEFRIAHETVTRNIRRYKRFLRKDQPERVIDNKIEFTQHENDADLSGQAKSLDDLLEKAKVDLNLWEVEYYEIKENSWDVTMKNVSKNLHYNEGKATGYIEQIPGGDTVSNYQFYIRVKLKRRQDFSEKSIKKFIEKIPEFKFSYYIPQNINRSGIALEMATLDAHFGKLAWIGETNYRNYDTDIAAQDYEYAVDKNLNWSSHEKLEKIFYIIGQDMFHVDNMKNHTTNGEHHMDVDGRMPKIIDKVLDVSLKSIYKCRSVAPVEIIWSPGNHDSLASLFLTYMLKEHFRNDQFVEVDITREIDGKTTRKARLWGNLLVGWTHRIVGKENTWGNELAQQFPKLWGESKFREWHCGDQHKKKTTKTMPEFTSGGVLIRQLTALSPVDKWHFENVFTDAVPGGEAFLWSKDCGIYANYIAWTGQYDDNRDKLVNK